MCTYCDTQRFSDVWHDNWHKICDTYCDTQRFSDVWHDNWHKICDTYCDTQRFSDVWHDNWHKICDTYCDTNALVMSDMTTDIKYSVTPGTYRQWHITKGRFKGGTDGIQASIFSAVLDFFYKKNTRMMFLEDRYQRIKWGNKR